MSYRITSIVIDPDVCACDGVCSAACPEVFDGDTPTGVPVVKAGAETLFESKADDIERAAQVCPVEAIKLTKAPV